VSTSLQTGGGETAVKAKDAGMMGDASAVLEAGVSNLIALIGVVVLLCISSCLILSFTVDISF